MLKRTAVNIVSEVTVILQDEASGLCCPPLCECIPHILSAAVFYQTVDLYS